MRHFLLTIVIQNPRRKDFCTFPPQKYLPCFADTFIRLYFMFYLKNDRHLILLHRIAALPQNTDLSMVLYVLRYI